MEKYNPLKIEKKWQKVWDKEKVFQAVDSKPKAGLPARPKWYSLVEFPYPSGAGMHVGHIRSNTAMDIISRKRRMEGYNVLYPMGWDAFGLPTENYAIKTGISPQVATKKNTDTFRRQLKAMGYSFDWNREIDTTDPAYYKWTQWIFQQFFKNGLAYKAEAVINWCPKDKTGLANEEVVGGKCERCGTAVEQKKKEQWMLKITAYADKLLDGLKDVDYLPEIKAQQENWIGRSEGAEIDFKLAPSVIASMRSNPSHSVIPAEAGIQGITVFTTRPDTIFGATYLVLAPEHGIVAKSLELIVNKGEVEKYVAATKLKNDLDRTEAKIKTGVELKGITAINPATKEEIPVWTSDYVLATYGTGAIMAVPAHDERDRAFAEKFNLPIVDKPLVSVDEAIKITDGKKTVKYKLRDWVFSRQRYWGEPIPLVFCQNCASNPTHNSQQATHSSGWVCVPEKDLPLKLPKVAKYQPTDSGESPLATLTKWVNTKCPQCKGPAKRETDTMPNWAGSSWYYLAYLMSSGAFKKSASIENWKLEIENYRHFMPVDWYNGGMEHVTLHLLYSRFWNLFLYDLGLVPGKEPYKKRTAHGMILASDGKKMSKSLGNVVNPDDLVKEFGADALRLYEMFIGPFNQAVIWDQRGILGTARFLEKVWRLGIQITSSKSQVKTEERTLRLLHKTIKKVGEDIEAMNFNTAVSAMMIYINEISSVIPEYSSGIQDLGSRVKPGTTIVDYKISIVDWGKFLRILSPFAPHIAEELNYKLQTTNYKLVCQQPWPEYDVSLLTEDTFELIIQVNSKVRGKVAVPQGTDQASAEKFANTHEEVKKWLTGPIKKVVYVPGRLINLIV